MTGFENLTPEDSLILTNAIAISLAKGKNADEINVIGNFLVGIGCLLLTIASHQQYLTVLQESRNSNSTQNNNNNSNNTNNNNNNNNAAKSTAADDVIIG
ncbi:hypothetical protein [Clostridium beijerinckii]|uniref:Uncharacterized protein n=1 Tax=Clostridium beijerinckii TaxID=1520 RepID=A0A9Q5CQJ8_CLOBE|nr:hypothetical protein [Clostridium beijerinckii]AQS05701.1 hypothetical protein CLBIJ_31430 [Clostridium beijerinckii]MBA2885328.1 hypothetical protein [Clostridium beijerinckii]MBA2900171.1 hypothetical protein [Clostridium beijerinckii]MBA2909800.1 hypothetical protein [Clostridium beijerinckii]MBA9014705.1 hypothetical protein [Clostridium beijerinckii]